ncbi:hypothetical protein D4740_03775 [Actinomyces sp. 2119]|uniref:Flp pilus assembly protein, pilin Flp n=1 Tax=Actinomyces lilanjuaniae TaxID=2321394 RepID=A0ABN5PQ64_9ACTO|nr:MULTISPECIES: hypothetical protein [Actinomyces]AYD90496.1 hypothetical protein D5R93_11700 [Actinomyces lilanjuaniae]RJF44054.1 hypothetical protein D4740_03775 [Actinomyces sp. 2119]
MLQLLCTLQVVAQGLRDRLSQAARRLSDDRGVSTVEWVIITGFLIVLAAVVGRAVYAMVDNASSDLQVPSIP